MGDYSYPCFPLAKELRKAPPAIAADIAARLAAPPFVASVEAAGPYLNFRLHPGQAAEKIITQVETHGQTYGSGEAGRGKTVVIDYSSPNVAKNLAFHHIRSTMIGQALCNLHRASGWEVVGINHLGDWGTTFGKLMVAVKKLAPADFLESAGLADLHAMYVAFHKAAETDEALEEEARGWFLRLEEGDPEARSLWERFREISLADFARVFDMLGVRFDHVMGESFFLDRLAGVIARAEEAGITQVSDGALVIPMGDDMPPALLRKKDGATLYVTRDLAAAIYRHERWDFDRCLYVTDAGQSLHFKQLFASLDRMGMAWSGRMEHVPFGIILMGGQRGKTREGNVVLLTDVLDEARRRTADIMAEKNPDLPNPDAVAETVGVGAVVFNDLKNKRVKDVNFDWETVLSFDGDTGPYVQYAHVRVHGILRKYEGVLDGPVDYDLLAEPEVLNLVLLLGRLPSVVARAADTLEPSVLAQYLLETAAAFHRFHHHHRVIGEDKALTAARVRLVRAVGIVLRNGLALLSLGAPEQM
jgi:arginyl-tRNA synthetase